MNILLLVLKEALGFLFSSKKMAIYTLISLGALSVTGSVWYLTNKYGNMKMELMSSKLLSDALQEANKNMALQIGDLVDAAIKKQQEFDDALAKREELEHNLAHVKSQQKEALGVFEKECGRVDRLMQKKSGLVVRAANRATQRVWDDFKEATNSN